MIIKCRVNKDDNKMFRLVEFNAGYFNADNKLKLITDDIRLVKNIFSNIESIEIFVNDNPITETTSYDSYSSISYLGTIWCEGEQTFVDCLEITLTKINLIDEVERIKNIVEPVHDEASMTLQALKDWRISQISAAGSEDIYAGDFVELSDKTTKHFKYGQHDQANLESYLALILASDDREHLYVAYHSDEEVCRQYSYVDIVLIYFTLSLKKLRVFTYVNMLRDWVRTMTDIEQVRNIQYGVELPSEYQTQMNEIMQGSLASLMAIKEKFIPSIEPEPTPDPDEDGDEPTPEPITDGENNEEE